MDKRKIHAATRTVAKRLATHAREAGLGAWRTSRVGGSDRAAAFRITRTNRNTADVLYHEMLSWLYRNRDMRSFVGGSIMRTARGWQVEINVELHPKSVDAHVDDRTTAEDLGAGDVLADGRTVAWTMPLEGGDILVGFVLQGSDRHDPRELFDVTMRGVDNPEREW